VATSTRYSTPVFVWIVSRVRPSGEATMPTPVAAGRGICLVPAAIADQSSSGDVAFVPVRDADPAVVSLAWRGDARPVVRTLIETAARVAASVQRLSAGR
jgi:DNA-binding transcriptional LysR family regulator